MDDPMVPLYVRLPASLRDRLTASAETHGRPLSWEVRRLLEEGLPIDLRPVRVPTPLKVPPMPPELIEEVERAKKAREEADVGPLARGVVGDRAERTVVPDPGKPVKCPHPKDQRTSYGSCKACGRRV